MATRTLFIFLSMFLFHSSSAAASETWEFYSEFGQVVTFELRDQMYSFVNGDVGELDVGCAAENEGYRVCLNTTFISVAVPLASPEIGDTWEISTVQGRAKFKVEWISKKLNWLGQSFSDVFVIEVLELETVGVVEPIAKASRVWFTYDEGWIAFQVGDSPVKFIAGRLPSLGASERK